MDKADKISVMQAFGFDDEALEIVVDLINGDYTVKNLRNDYQAYFEPDDRDDSWITFTDKDK